MQTGPASLFKATARGGGHAVMLALDARDRGEIPLCFLALTYPMLDDRTGTSRQLPGHIGEFVWPPRLNALGWRALLGGPPGVPNVPNAAAPGRVRDLARLPPTFLAVGDIDLFVDEGLDFVRRLVLAGVPVEALILPGAYHGFDVLAPDASVSRRYRAAHLAALARAFDRL